MPHPAKGRAREQLAALGLTDEALLDVCATSHPSADSLIEFLERPTVAIPLAICVTYGLVKLYLYLG